MRTVFFDIDTQLDFVSPAGALYVPGAERIMPTVAHLNQLAGQRSIPVISTMDAHPENDIEFRDWPPHCVAETIGQQKPAGSLLERSTSEAASRVTGGASALTRLAPSLSGEGQMCGVICSHDRESRK